MAINWGTIGLGALIGGPFGAAAGLQYEGNQQAAQAQGKAAEAQLAEARATRAAATSAAAPTTGELRALSDQLDYQQRAVGRQEKLLDSIDPALLESGRQALALLRGEESNTLAPLRAERDRQRQALVNSLIAREGAGALTSSAGIEALNRFDQQTSATLAGQQQSTLGDLLRVAQASRPDPYGAVQSSALVAQTQAQPGNRMVSAINATPITQYAGAPFLQSALQGQNLAGIGKSFNDTAATLAGGAAGKGLAG
jgi:hypothetical protein